MATITIVASVGLLATAPPAEAQTKQQAFIAKVADAAQTNQAIYNVPASVTIAQAILETGWGGSNLSTKYNNYFGIKCTSTASPHQLGCVTLTTTEYYPTATGGTQIKASFRTYRTVADSFKDHGRLLSTASRYAAAFAYTQNPDQFIREVRKGGYATDPKYADTIISLMKTYKLYDYNLTPEDPKVTATPAQKTAFFNRVGPQAQYVQLIRGIPASVLMTQAALSTNYGLSPLAAKTQNYFGLTCKTPASAYQSGCYKVTRMVNGKLTTTSLRMYRSYTASFNDMGYILSAEAKFATARKYPNGPETFMSKMAQTGAFGNSTTYFNSLLPIMRSNKLYRFDVPFTTLRSGNNNFRVMALNRMLMTEGYKTPFSSVYGPATVTAVRHFQARFKLAGNGVATRETLKVMSSRFATKPMNQKVAALQTLLRGKGYSTKVWAVYDATTATRVAQFNAKNYGPSGSTIGVVTWGKLFS